MTLNCIFVNDVSFWKMIMKRLWTHFDGTKTTIWLYLMLFGQWFWSVKWIQMAHVLISLVHANKQLHGELQTENRWSKELLLVWGTQVTIMVKNHPTDAPNTVVRMWTLKGFSNLWRRLCVQTYLAQVFNELCIITFCNTVVMCKKAFLRADTIACPRIQRPQHVHIA
jgi:hypothetical protein